MNGFSRIMGAYLRHYNTMFWLVFLIAGALFIGSAVLGLFGLSYLDLVLGLVLAAAGIHRIGDEFFRRSVRKSQEDSARTISELLQWAEKSYDYTREFKDKHEKRIHRLDQKRALHEQNTEEMFRDAVRKIIQMENRLSEAVRHLERPAIVRSGRGESPLQPMQDKDMPAPVTVTVKSDSPATAKSGEADRPAAARQEPKPPATKRRPAPRIRDLSPVQTRAISHMRKSGSITNKEYRKLFRVKEKRAYSDLASMRRMGLISRRGKGRGTHYVLAF